MSVAEVLSARVVEVMWVGEVSPGLCRRDFDGLG